MQLKILTIFVTVCGSVLFAEAQAYHSVLITEIFADPTPSRGLPEKEYIELYNNSGSSIELKGFELHYNTSKVTFPDYELKPGGYVIVTRFNNAELFKPFGEVIPLSQFSLLNSGTTLSLYNPEGQLVFEVTYSKEWYSPGRDQGYSLEMIDLNYACKEDENWTSSLSELGATPGQPNAASNTITDTEPPKLLNLSSDDNRIFHLVFSENINETAAEITVSLEPKDIDIVRLTVMEGNVLAVELETEISHGHSYLLVINGIADCIGNSSEIIEVELSNIKKAGPGDLLLSEVLFNPRTDGYDFVEIVNISDQRLSLKEVGFSKRNNLGEVEEPDYINGSVIIEPGQYLCFTENKEAQRLNYPRAVETNIVEIPNLPSYTNEAGEVILMDSDGQIFDSFNYSEDMHHVSIDDPDGVSLERILSSDSGSEKGEWRSASASENFATPGYAPVMINDDFSGNFRLTLTPESFTPDNDGIDEETEILIQAQDSGLLDLSIFDINGVLVSTIASNQYTNRRFRTTWNGMNSLGGRLSTGYYIVVAQYVTEGEVLLAKSKILLAHSK